MRSDELDLKRYDTDKIANRYLERYDPILQPLVDREIRLLEIGVHNGGSLLLWRDYFRKGTIVGIDLELPNGLANEERIQLFQGSQSDPAFLSEVARKIAPDGFDIIIDDASHFGELTKIAFSASVRQAPQTLWPLCDRGLGHRILGRLARWERIPSEITFPVNLAGNTEAAWVSPQSPLA